jgi:methionyl-tRNA synthetase
MSKSVGNVIDPFNCLNKFTTDGTRYVLLREGVPDSDCNLSLEKFPKLINAELVNALANLYNRCLPFNKQRIYPSFNEIEQFLDEKDKFLIQNLNNARNECDVHFSKFNFYRGIQVIMTNLRMTNNLVQEYKPWELIKSNDKNDASKLNKMIFLVYESLRISSILFQPIVPDLASELLDRLSIENRNRFFSNCVVNTLHLEDKKKINLYDTVLFKRL